MLLSQFRPCVIWAKNLRDLHILESKFIIFTIYVITLQVKMFAMIRLIRAFSYPYQPYLRIFFCISFCCAGWSHFNLNPNTVNAQGPL